MQASKFLGVMVMIAAFAVTAVAQVAAGAPSAPATQVAPQTNQPQQPAQPAPPPGQTIPTQGVPQVPLAEGAPLRVMVNKSILVNTADRL